MIPAAEHFAWQPRSWSRSSASTGNDTGGGALPSPSADGTRAASGDEFGNIALYEVSSQKLLQTFEVPCQVLNLAFAPDANSLAVGENPGHAEVYLWNIRGMPHIEHAIAGWADFFASRPRVLTDSGPNDSVLWDMTTNPPQARARLPRGRHLARSPDGQTLVLTSTDGKAVRLYDAKPAGPKERGTVPVTAEVHRAVFLPDGRLAVFDTEGWSLWDVSGAQPRSLARVKGPNTLACWSRDGRQLFTGNYQVVSPVTLWDLRQLPPVQRGQFNLAENNASGANLTSLAVSPDAKTLLSGHLNGMVCFCDIATGKEKRPLATAAIRPDVNLFPPTLATNGSGIATFGCDGKVHLWELDGKAPRKREVFADAAIRSIPLGFRPEGNVRLTTVQYGHARIEGWDLGQEKPTPVKLVDENRDWRIGAIARAGDNKRVVLGLGGGRSRSGTWLATSRRGLLRARPPQMCTYSP